MEFGWMDLYQLKHVGREFLKGMLRPVLATAVVFLVVGLSFLQQLGLEEDMIFLNGEGFFTAVNNRVTVTGYTAGQRAKHVPCGRHIAGASIFVGTAVTMFLLLVLNIFPFTPRYIIPVAGMMVGNAMTVTGVTMKKLREDLKIQMSLVESALALGSTPRQATLHQVKRALIIALSPVMDNAKTVGLISLPDAMTGLIMGGASLMEAVQLQIVGTSTVSSITST